jgi:hypothetical protein
MIDIESIFKEIKIPIFIPSLQKIEYFSSINTTQLLHLQKSAHKIEDLLDPSFYNVVLDVIKQNAGGIDLSTLTVWDFEYIAWSYYNSIYFPETTLAEIVIPEPVTFTYKNIKLQISIPTINRHLAVEKWLFENINDISEPEIIKLVDIHLTKSILLEISKYLSVITMEDSVINLADISLDKAVQLIQSLPANLFESIFAQIKEWQITLKTIFPRHFGPWLFNKT